MDSIPLGSIPLEATLARPNASGDPVSNCRLPTCRSPSASRTVFSPLASFGSGLRVASHGFNHLDQVNAQEPFENVISPHKADTPSIMLSVHSDREGLGVNRCPISFTHTVKDRLMEAKKQARIRRWRISLPCITIGLFLWCIGVVVSLYIIHFRDERASVVTFLLQAIAAVSVVICLLGLLPEDHCAIRIAIMITVSMHLLVALTMASSIRRLIKEDKDNHCILGGRVVSCSTTIIRLIVYSVAALGLMFHVFRDIHSLFLRPRRMLQNLWSITGCTLLILSTWYLCQFFLVTIISFSIGSHDLHSLFNILLCGITSASGSFAMWPKFRFRVQAWLAAKGESAVSAAGVAVLLGASNIEDIIAASRASFRAVSAEKLTEADMADQTPNPALCDLTERVVLGQVDAFVSHSWHDDPQSKWIELQNWRRDFKKEFGREPRLWIDKYCVDQSNIEKSLSCLPVYLMGCQRLLLLCGSTYLHRLWCLVEILVFKEMGGLQTNFECRHLNGGEGMQTCIECFDVYEAKCFTEHDTSRLLAVMEAAADSLDELSDWIRSCLRKNAGDV